MAFHTEDKEENVLENRRRFFKIFDQNVMEIISAIQIHGADLAVIGYDNLGQGAIPGSAVCHCDALLTTEPELALTAYSADCLLIYFAAIDTPLIAIAHAGRRGTLQGIAGKVIKAINKEYNLSPDRIQAVLSPAICKNCYTINSEIAVDFEAAGWADRNYLEQLSSGKWKLDLAAINKTQLLEAGVKGENLEISPLCTSCRNDLFYSYRRDQGRTGRMIGFIRIRSSREEKRFER